MIQKQKNLLDKVSLISKKISMKVNEYLPNLDVEVPVWFDALGTFLSALKMAYLRPFSNIISIKTARATTPILI
jgi:hypothetical protein